MMIHGKARTIEIPKGHKGILYVYEIKAGSKYCFNVCVDQKGKPEKLSTRLIIEFDENRKPIKLTEDENNQYFDITTLYLNEEEFQCFETFLKKEGYEVKELEFGDDKNKNIKYTIMKN